MMRHPHPTPPRQEDPATYTRRRLLVAGGLGAIPLLAWTRAANTTRTSNGAVPSTSIATTTLESSTTVATAGPSAPAVSTGTAVDSTALRGDVRRCPVLASQLC